MMIHKSALTNLMSSPDLASPALGVCHLFQTTQAAAQVIEQHPEMVMEVALRRFPEDEFILMTEGGRELLRYGNVFGSPFFYGLHESDGQETRKVPVPAYPHVVAAFTIMQHQARMEEALYDNRDALAVSLLREGKSFGEISQAEHEEYWKALIIPFGEYDCYRSVNLLSFYHALYSISQRHSSVDNATFADFGFGLGYVCFMASLFFESVIGYEILEPLYEKAQQAEGELSTVLPSTNVRLEKQDFFKADLGNIDYLFFWQELAGSMIPLFERFEPGTYLLPWKKWWSDRYLLSMHPSFTFRNCIGRSDTEMYVYERTQEV